mmetsp:Transcript_11304/g.30200  ORF Transcript_11304/g.30200 Transcript_11304/m.30200 type:complete len:388 (-) Transcript_11304:1-1164(-)
MLVSVPREECELGERLRVASHTDEVVALKGALLLLFQVLERVVAHGPGFRIVECRVHVQVQEILSGVFADTEVSRRSSQLVVFRGHRRRGLVEILHLLAQVLVVRGVAVAIRVGVGVAVAPRVGISSVCARSPALRLAPELPSTLLPLLFEDPLLGLQPLPELRSFLHFRGLDFSTLRLDRLPFVDHFLVILGLEAVPPVPLALIVELDFFDVLVGHQILPIEFRTHLAGALHAIYLLVCRRTTIFAGALDELRFHVVLGPALVPILAARRLQVPGLLMGQGRLALVQVPRRLRDELRVVGVDHLSCGSIQFGCRCTRSTGLLQLLLPFRVIARSEAVRHGLGCHRAAASAEPAAGAAPKQWPRPEARPSRRQTRVLRKPFLAPSGL